MFDNKIFSDYDIKKSFDSINEIKKFDFEKIIEEKLQLIEKIKKKDKLVFKDLSKYIKLYLQKKIEIENYTESKYIQIKKFDENSYFKYYEDDERGNFCSLREFLVRNEKEIFLTGPHGIGKTFTLLYLIISDIIHFYDSNIQHNENLVLFINNSKVYKVYFNLEVLSKEKIYFEIIIYETRFIFDSKDNYINFYKSIYSKLSNINYLECIFIIFEEFIKIYSNKRIIIILDQFKFSDENDIKKLEKIRNLVEKSSNLYLIICSSLNYKAVKKSLIFQLNSNQFNKNVPYFKLFNKLTNNKNLFSDNIYLQDLGYLPIYCQIKDSLSQKLVNVLKKKIKFKIKKFHKSEYEMIKSLKKIIINEKLPSRKFEEIMDNFPIKYLNIDLKNKIYNYLYPLAKTAIDELIYSYKIKERFCVNESEEGWKFENIIFDCISNKNEFLNFYIHKSFKIETIFNNDEKLSPNFDMKENTLISFKFFNVKRYNGALYLGEIKTLVLLQASINKTKKELEQYNNINLSEDLIDINPFLKENGIKPEKYYVLFILDYQNYTEKKEYKKILKDFSIQYILFDQSTLGFHLNSFTNFSHEIKLINKIETKKYKQLNKCDRIIFTKDFDFENVQEDYLGPIYAVYKGMNFIDFMNEIFDDFLNNNKNFFCENNFQKSFVLKYFGNLKEFSLIGIKGLAYNFGKDSYINIIFFYLCHKDLVFTKGSFKNGKLNFSRDIVAYENFNNTKIIYSQNFEEKNGFASLDYNLKDNWIK